MSIFNNIDIYLRKKSANSDQRAPLVVIVACVGLAVAITTESTTHVIVESSKEPPHICCCYFMSATWG